MAGNKFAENDFRCGYATIVGRPNVGKSTFLNRIIGQKLSITSRKPQTTQRRLLGIRSNDDYQIVFIDTPGLQDKYQDAINRYMRREIMSALLHIDVIVFMVESLKWSRNDERILNIISATNNPLVLLINKIDRIRDKEKLLPYIQDLSERNVFTDIIPISASKDINISEVEETIRALLPIASAAFPDDQITDRSERYIVAEFIREKLVRLLGDELPYRISVTIENFSRRGTAVTIHAIIWVESASQKSIVIGKGGKVLKSAGELARKDMQTLFASKVYLRTWVKVKKNWSADRELLKQLGFES